jgi:[acyl-carrier-protein] S-malonyltransferase
VTEFRPHDTRLQGERLMVPERMIVAPAVGIFRPAAVDPGSYLEEGVSIGSVDGPGSSISIESPFTGELVGILAFEGERLREGQPVAWLRVA